MVDFDVVASGIGLGFAGEPVIKVFTPHQESSRGIPRWLEGVRVHTEVSSRFYALKHETCDVSGDAICETSESWPLPVPIGVSIGHPEITAGTIGARVTDGTSVFMLSNNHVLANSNQAGTDDSIFQPGVFDGGTSSDDIIAGLTDFEPIAFCTVGRSWLFCDQTNTIDAAIALSSSTELGVKTPIGEFGSTGGYGAPSSLLHSAYGTPDTIGDEELTLLLGISVQKYGRTTALTRGTVDAIGATVDVCFDASCQKVARFVDQLLISPSTFSAGGDSGSLIVTDDDLKQPVGLLFAGGSEYTVANRIDLVLDRFGVTIDDREELSPVNETESHGGGFYVIPNNKGGVTVIYLD